MANGNNKWKLTGVVLTLVVLVGGWLVTWGQTVATIDSLERQVAKNEEARDTTLTLQKDVEYIKQKLEEQDHKLEKQDTKLDKILDKLNELD